MAGMSKKVTLDQFHGMLQEMAAAALSEIKSQIGKKKWKLGFVDIRAPVQGTSWMHKLRVELSDKTIVRSLDAPVGVIALLTKVWDAKDKLFPQKWYGLKLTVFPDGKCETEFNYDADCINDPDFFDVDAEYK